MRAIFINTEKRTVEEWEYDGDWKTIAEKIGCRYFTIVTNDPFYTLYVDDEGLLNEPSVFFKIRGYPQPLAGNGVILGIEDAATGETLPLMDSVAASDIASDVKFIRYDNPAKDAPKPFIKVISFK